MALRKMRILWLAPNLNHYKARFLEVLNDSEECAIHVLAGLGSENVGHTDILTNAHSFSEEKLPVSKQKFGRSWLVFIRIYSQYKDFDWIMIPREKKNIPLLFALFLLRYTLFVRRKTRLFSYNHPFFDNKRPNTKERILLKLMYRGLDRTIFYTKQSAKWALQEKVISPEKARWANNTLDDREVLKVYSFELPDQEEVNILFVSRLIPSKRLDILIDYFNELSFRLSGSGKRLSLTVVGDGPERGKIEEASKVNGNIAFLGSITNEAELAPLFRKASILFNPGHSGLHINHSFLYGRPYVTIEANHAPEYSYLVDGINGLILSGNKDDDLNRLQKLLTDPEQLNELCQGAWESSQELSVVNWKSQIVAALS